MGEKIKLKPDKCKACRRCEIACIAAHYNMPFKEAMKYKDSLTSRAQVVKIDGVKASLRCQQCDPAPCCGVCPMGALRQDENGVITMNEEICVGCKMCVAACPYGAVSMSVTKVISSDESLPVSAENQAPQRQVAVRCDMCQAWRMENGKKITACMEACPVQGLYIITDSGDIIEVPKPEKASKAQAAPAE